MKINKRVISIIVIILLLIIVFTGFKLLSNKSNKKNIEKIDEEVTLDPDKVIDLLSYIPYTVFNVENYHDAYHGQLVNNNDISSTILSPLLVSYRYDNYGLKEQENTYFKKIMEKDNYGYVGIFKTNDIDKYLSKYYNLELNSIKNIEDKIKIAKIDKTYTEIVQNKYYGYAIVYKSKISIEGVQATSSSAVIKEKIIFFTQKNDKYYAYKNTNIYDNQNIIKIYDTTDEDGNLLNSDDMINKIRNDFENYNYVFKHTFKKNKTGYYWYSTEFIEEE